MDCVELFAGTNVEEHRSTFGKKRASLDWRNLHPRVGFPGLPQKNNDLFDWQPAVPLAHLGKRFLAMKPTAGTAPYVIAPKQRTLDARKESEKLLHRGFRAD
jgi:hypothetical protein